MRRFAGFWSTLLVVAGLALGLSGCAAPSTAGGQPTPAAGPPPTSPIGSVPPSPVVSPVPDPEAQAVVAAVLADAAAHLGLGVNDLRTQQVEPREWSDSSLGCPRPGVMYLQVVTPGYLVIVVGGGKTLEYHADSRGRVVLCDER